MEIPSTGDRLPHRLLEGTRELSTDFAEELLWKLALNEKLIESDTLDQLIKSFETQQTLDAYSVVCSLAESSSDIAALLGGRTGVREGYRLHEHTQAVLNGFERDYAGDFPRDNERKLLRTALLLQDIGKSLCIAHCGNRREQAPYNAAMVENLMLSISEDALSQDDRLAVQLLLNHDILGSTMKGYKGIAETEAEARVQEVERLFPRQYERECRTFMHAIYMSDATAYTSFRSYISSETGQSVTCIPGLNEEYKVFERADDGKVKFVDPDNNAKLRRLTNYAKA